MEKAKLALIALMIGTMTIAGASFAEAKPRVDDAKIIVDTKNEHKPPKPDTRKAPKSSEIRRPDKSKHDSDRPEYKPADDRGPKFGSHHEEPHGSGYNKHGHDAPPPPPHHRPKPKHHM